MAIELQVREGPEKGRMYAIDDPGELTIGRGGGGIMLRSPEVDLKHAKLNLTHGRLLIADLSSDGGTKVNGRLLNANLPTELQMGDEFRIGDTTFVVTSPATRALRRSLWMMLPGWLFVFATLALLVWLAGESEAAWLRFPNPYVSADGPVNEVAVPHAFMRTHGLSLVGMAVHLRTDLDHDGIEELWLVQGDREFVVTQTADGDWQLVALLPRNCRPRTTTGATEIECTGSTYRRGRNGIFEEESQRGLVVWLRGVPPPPEDAEVQESPAVSALRSGSVVPVRVDLADEEALAGFLADRGIDRGVHYVLCDGVSPGIPRQAMQQGGVARGLSRDCGTGLRLEGSLAPALGAVEVVGLAVTGQGHARAAQNIRYTISGSDEAVFLDPDSRIDLDGFERTVFDLRGLLSVGFKATPHILRPLASDELGPRVRLLSEREIPGDVISARILEPGVAVLKGEGCAVYEIETSRFRCAMLRGCGPWSGFVAVREIGCGLGEMLHTGYSPGQYLGEADGHEVSVELAAEVGWGLKQITSARVAIRATPTP